jgi:hypothetical protein
VIATTLRKINFGCGYDKRDGYLNVDVDPACQPDLLIVDDDYSVIPSDSFDEILALDVLEHIPRAQTAAVLLDWADYLVMDGLLHVQTSSITGVAQQMATSPSFADQFGWTICLFGNQAHPGDFHYTGFTETTLRVHLLAAGFDVGAFSIDDGWLLSVDAVKTEAWTGVVTASAGRRDNVFVTELYQAAFGRDVDDNGLTYLTTELKAGRMTRRDAARHIYSSPERLFRTAERAGL